MPDRVGQCQPRACQIGILCHQETLFGRVVALVPQSVEGGGEVAEVESDPVRLVGGRRTLDDARELCGELDQLRLKRQLAS